MLTFFYCLNQFKTHLQNQTGSNSIIDTDFTRDISQTARHISLARQIKQSNREAHKTTRTQHESQSVMTITNLMCD